MSVERSRTAFAVTDEAHGRTVGRWTTWLLLTVLSTFMAGLVAAGLYLHTGQEAWPPAELTRPGRGWALAALGLLVVTAVTANVATSTLRRHRERASTNALAVSAFAAIGTVLALTRDLAAVGFRWDVHAYASIYWVNTAVAAMFVGFAALLLLGVLIQRLVGVVDPTRMLELEASLLYVWWTVGAVAACLAVAHLLPDPAAGLAAGLSLVRP